MTTKIDFPDARARLGLSQTAMATFLGVDRRTYQAWELAERSPPHAVVLLLRWMAYDEKPKV